MGRDHPTKSNPRRFDRYHCIVQGDSRREGGKPVVGGPQGDYLRVGLGVKMDYDEWLRMSKTDVISNSRELETVYDAGYVFFFSPPHLFESHRNDSLE